MKRLTKQLSIALLASCLIFTTACNSTTLDKVINILSAAPQLVASFGVVGTEATTIVNAFADATTVIKALKDKTTTLDKAEAALDAISNLHSTSAQFQARLNQIVATAKIILAAVSPSTTARRTGRSVDVSGEVEHLKQLMQP